MSQSSLVAYTKLSPNMNAPRKNAIDTLTIHCVVGQVTAERLGEIFANPNRQASSNYGVDKDGRVGQYVLEENRSWCSATGNNKDTNDHRAITIEVASDTSSPYAVTYAAFSGLIDLCVEICKRLGKKKMVYLGSREATEKEWAKGYTDIMYLTAHRWFANTDCPGEYLYSRFKAIAELVTDRLTEEDKTVVTGTPITFYVTSVKKGTQGDMTKRVQAILKGLEYYTGNIDGDAGALTDKAIRSYQQARSLEVDGSFGPACWKNFLGI